MAVSAPTQVRALAKAVATAFAAATLTEEERHPPRIHITDLPWACPPLNTSLTLEGGSMQDYLDAPLDCTPQRLHRFWTEATQMLWHEPSRAFKGGTYALLSAAMPAVKLGQRALRFSTPAGAPAQVDEMAGITLALEVAHAALISFPVKQFWTNHDDFVVELADGTRFGVEEGRALVPSPFAFNAKGMVSDLLDMQRGEISYRCHYDQIAAVRSVLHSYPERFPATFEALDQALQALRYLALGGYCPELSTALVVQPMEMLRLKEREVLYREAIELVVFPGISDRSKLETLLQGLVPAAMSLSKFRREIFSSDKFPFALAPGKLADIEATLRNLYKSEIPTGLQRPL